MIYFTLKRVQFIPISIEEAWKYFSQPSNLGEITPPDLKFIIQSKPEEIQTMYEGLIIDYKISPFPGIFFNWQTKIISVEEKKSFTDIQVKGPYALWEHTHTFKAVDGGTEMADDLKYILPFRIFGRIAHKLFIRKKIENIFDYRYRKIEELFGKDK